MGQVITKNNVGVIKPEWTVYFVKHTNKSEQISNLREMFEERGLHKLSLDPNAPFGHANAYHLLVSEPTVSKEYYKWSFAQGYVSHHFGEIPQTENPQHVFEIGDDMYDIKLFLEPAALAKLSAITGYDYLRANHYELMSLTIDYNIVLVPCHWFNKYTINEDCQISFCKNELYQIIDDDSTAEHSQTEICLATGNSINEVCHMTQIDIHVTLFSRVKVDYTDIVVKQ